MENGFSLNLFLLQVTILLQFRNMNCMKYFFQRSDAVVNIMHIIHLAFIIAMFVSSFISQCNGEVSLGVKRSAVLKRYSLLFRNPFF